MSTTALACIDALFSEAELANGNTGGSFGYQKLDEQKVTCHLHFVKNLTHHRLKFNGKT